MEQRQSDNHQEQIIEADALRFQLGEGAEILQAHLIEATRPVIGAGVAKKGMAVWRWSLTFWTREMGLRSSFRTAEDLQTDGLREPSGG